MGVNPANGVSTPTSEQLVTDIAFGYPSTPSFVCCLCSFQWLVSLLEVIYIEKQEIMNFYQGLLETYLEPSVTSQSR